MAEVRSAYVHVPFCSHRCGYCNFTLIAGRADLVPSYLDALGRELELTLGEPSEVETLFLGGGTPSFLNVSELERLLELLNHWLPTASSAEVSCEVNPLDCRPEKLEVLCAAGVNRVSIGGQSFSARKLSVLQRDHSPEELRKAIATCQQYFDRVSLDLIFAAPEESLEEWQADLKAATESGVAHLSTYGLTVEKGSMFFGRVQKGELAELDSDLQRELYKHTIDFLVDQDWTHYEVSNFTLGAEQCRHNEAYWLGQYWWGFGPGAASFLPVKVDDDSDSIAVRAVNHQSTTLYLRRLTEAQGHSAIQALKTDSESLSNEDYIRERVVFGLRRLAGVNLNALDQEFECDVAEMFQPTLTDYLKQGWLSLDESRQLTLTQAGLFISDGLWPDLLVPP